MQEAKQKANQMKEPADVWELERHLTKRRKNIDDKYDFRSSRLTRLLGALLCEGRVTGADLCGLPEDKLKVIRSWAKLLSQDVA